MSEIFIPKVSDVRDEQHRYAMQLRHKLAMESVGLIRTCLNVQRPAFEALLNAEKEAHDDSQHQSILHNKSFVMQLKLVRTCLKFLDELDVLADEVVELAAKEKFHG